LIRVFDFDLQAADVEIGRPSPAGGFRQLDLDPEINSRWSRRERRLEVVGTIRGSSPAVRCSASLACASCPGTTLNTSQARPVPAAARPVGVGVASLLR